MVVQHINALNRNSQHKTRKICISNARINFNRESSSITKISRQPSILNVQQCFWYIHCIYIHCINKHVGRTDWMPSDSPVSCHNQTKQTHASTGIDENDVYNFFCNRCKYCLNVNISQPGKFIIDNRLTVTTDHCTRKSSGLEGREQCVVAETCPLCPTPGSTELRTSLELNTVEQNDRS